MGQVKTYASIQGYSLRYACTDVQKANFFSMLDTTVLVTLFDDTSRDRNKYLERG